MLHRRTMAAAALVAALAAPVLVAAPSQAATKPTFTLKLAHKTVVEGKRLHIDGMVRPGRNRPVNVQAKLDGHWEDVFGFGTEADGEADLDVLGFDPGKHELRAFAPKWKSYAAVASNTVVWTVIARTSTTAAFTPAAPVVGQATKLTGKLHPASTGRVVKVQHLVGGHWAAYKSVSTVKGKWAVSVPTSTAAKHSYRVVVDGTKSKTKLVSHRWNLTPLYTTGVTAAPASTSVAYRGALTATGKVTSTDLAARVVSLQQRSGSAWHQVAKATVASNGSYSVHTNPTALGAHSYRVVVPRTAKAAASTSATFTATVVKAATTVTAAPSVTSVPYLDTFTVSGTIAGTVAGEVQYANLQRLDGDVWVPDSSNGVDGGAFSFTVSNSSDGPHTYRVVTDATEHGLAGVSPSFTVTVEPLEP